MISAYKDVLYGDAVGEAFADIITTWKIILACMGIAAILGFVYMIIIRLVGGPIIYISILVILLGLAGAGYYCYDYSSNYTEEENMY